MRVVMIDCLGPGTILGYCTNVHAGETLDQVQTNLESFSLSVKGKVSPNQPMGIGLWLSANAARTLVKEQRINAFAHWLRRLDLVPFTLNGFPYGDFHSSVVKHRVYQPDWLDPKRLAYTIDLIHILAGLLPDATTQKHNEGSISTLPIAWRQANHQPHHREAPFVDPFACQQLMSVLDCLEQIEQETGKIIHLNLEPEPGCEIQTSQDVVDLFEHHLDQVGSTQRNRRYLRVCHDTCHEAVMGETTQDALDRYSIRGIQIGKVQISSAVSVNFDALSDQHRREATQDLERFQDQRYLHQTTIQHSDASGLINTAQYEDLPLALASCQGSPTGRWCVHYHVPLFLDQVGLLETTNQHTISSLNLIASQTNCRHYEIETYAWDVLPHELATVPLSDGIAQEWKWLINHFSSKVPS